MTRICVVGAARSGVAVVANALAQSENATLRKGLTETLEDVADGDNVVALAADETPDCRILAATADILRRDPEVRAIVVWRQGVDFVNSRLRMRPQLHFVEHCQLWTRSQAMAQNLRTAFPERVDLVELRALLDSPAEVVGRWRAMVPGLKMTGETLARWVKSSPVKRASVMGRDPVVTAEGAGWSMGEVEAFKRIGGDALAGAGLGVDLAAAERRRPLDLGRMLYDRAYGFGGMAVVQSELAGAPWKISLSADEASQTAGLRLTAIAAGGRRHLRLRAVVRISDPSCSVRWEIVEAMSRRPLFGDARRGLGELAVNDDAVLPAHDGWLELAVTSSMMKVGSQIEVDLSDAKLSRV